jgi:TonB family protein
MRPLGFLILFLTLLGIGSVQGVTNQTNSKDKRPVLISGVRPEYPYEARVRRITGSGIAVMKIDRATGNVTSCEMAVSTGSRILDDAALAAFRTFRFKPGGPAMAKCPITFTMSGAANQVLTEYHVKEKPTDQALAPFLGKGTVDKGPMPAYPRSVPWTDKQGKGVYEIHVRKDGTVSDVKILKRSGDEVFDRTVVETLRTWRLRRGPLILELPLAFTLTPTHYSVNIPKNH